MSSYGAVPVAPTKERSHRTLLKVAVVAGAATLGAVAIADVMSKGVASTALLAAGTSGGAVMVPFQGQILYDPALEPLYKENGISAYKWKGLNAQGYDAGFQNAFKDLPTNRADIVDPDMEFVGKTQDMSNSCDKFGMCPPQENIFDELPSKEAKSLSTRLPDLFPEESHVFDNMPLDY
uniref:Uncharacterized protein n=2 Tax=Hemiselmis andersenii TaxID=464988 RepID=A0A6T8LST2_HEMAN|mmetsp:Transcript_11932/g.27798  ORF Transcript_11932/g.27798 Transcript_11932/m.27798 type:complete len:179 (+) Transcript_11932:12-548(+)|eukprot:CAMPEP_0114146854 /NCGR_PEP_ID=MMETSP0043_2-20121206/20786_1 /TAXON_ID=464988 /ORGANISM="Hemiselmis andersenii, Strain CCMP644" /LENGTH=178 /DNA_ID=CAMNT_0001241335 /DNA_START=6 /DNA_END=542 /DNA_ORIENTATION=-